MTPAVSKRTLLAELADVAKAVAHPHRLALLEQLAQGEHGVEAAAARTGLAVANASQHLQQLRRAGLVAARRDGKFVRYRLADDAALELLRALGVVAARSEAAAVRTLTGSGAAGEAALEPVSRAELLERSRRGLVTVLDVRPADEFALGHLPGAVNIPLDELTARLADIDPAREIVAYCRGPYCVLAHEAVALLRARGLKGRRLEDGFPEWRAAGLPVEVGARPA